MPGCLRITQVAGQGPAEAGRTFDSFQVRGDRAGQKRRLGFGQRPVLFPPHDRADDAQFHRIGQA